MTISPRMLPITPHIYAGGTLDRVSQRRADAAWIANAWRQPTAQVAPLWRGRCLQTLLPAVWAESLIASHDLPWALLGLEADTPVFTLDLSPLDQPPEPAGPFVDLRATTPLLAPGQAALLAYARALLEWRRRARFCGECGAPTRVEQAGHVTACTACGVRFFPRTDPTVIMLVTHGDRALLGHNARFPVRRMYSTLAGFVEPGESLEQAVAREVMEEAGIGLGTMRYHSSQPWPFPANLMLGFHAEAVTEDITVDAEELLDARWFSRAELRDPAAHGFELPPTFSIAYRLIDSWLVGLIGLPSPASTPGASPLLAHDQARPSAP